MNDDERANLVRKEILRVAYGGSVLGTLWAAYQFPRLYRGLFGPNALQAIGAFTTYIVIASAAIYFFAGWVAPYVVRWHDRRHGNRPKL
jgi:hypothetical protein